MKILQHFKKNYVIARKFVKKRRRKNAAPHEFTKS